MRVSCTTMIQEAEEVGSIGFESFTRGGYKSITMYKRKVVINKNHSAESYLLEEGDWAEFLQTLSEINTKELGEYQSNSNGRSRNAAWHSNIIVYTQDSVSHLSQAFDNDNAPAELSRLMMLFVAINKKYNKENSLF